MANLMFSKFCSAVAGRSQKIRSARSLQVMQLSTISIPYGESMYQPPVTTSYGNFGFSSLALGRMFTSPAS